jgi:hypothetical protein
MCGAGGGEQSATCCSCTCQQDTSGRRLSQQIGMVWFVGQYTGKGEGGFGK